jgi:hypothetical protein
MKGVLTVREEASAEVVLDYQEEAAEVVLNCQEEAVNKGGY